jgi:aspartate carbamoyltransferase catalytic subunit
VNVTTANLVSIADLSNDEIEEIFDLADASEKLRGKKVGSGKIMATLFYEPSTRTRLSFESSMQRLGGTVISCSDMQSSSAAKGESVADTAKVVSSYADVLVVRHYWDGAVQAVAEHADVQVINAGDGGHEHPSQTLCDLYTLRKEKGELKGLNVVICGDLKNGRTIHSLVYALARFGANVVTLAANGMELPHYVLERLEREFQYTLAPVASDDLSAVVTETDAFYLTPKQPHQLALFTTVDSTVQTRITNLVSGLRYDAFYMTRKQKERMTNVAKAGNYPVIGAKFLKEQRFKNTVVMHPLPRVDELSPELDKDRRGIYFKQAAYGVPIRMALLHFLFEKQRRVGISKPSKSSVLFESPHPTGPHCPNVKCITVNEPGSTRLRFELLSEGPAGALILRCLYCDHRFKVQLVGQTTTKKYCAYDIALAENIARWLKKGELAIFDSIKQAEELGYGPYKSGPRRDIMDQAEVELVVRQISEQILRECRDPDRLLIIGVKTNGSIIAQRIASNLERAQMRKFELAELETYGVGEDLRRMFPGDPELGPLQLRDRSIILVDDVIHTGRTVKHALSIIFRSGRPQSVRLAVLIDRGHREIPVKPNYVGKHIASADHERVRVHLRELEANGEDKVVVYSITNPSENRS